MDALTRIWIIAHRRACQTAAVELNRRERNRGIVGRHLARSLRNRVRLTVTENQEAARGPKG